MQNFDRQKIIVALLLLWLALAGGYVGWANPIILFINFLLWLGLMVWLCVRVPRLDRVGWAIIGLMVANLISAAATNRWYAGLTQAAILSAYLAIYYLARQWPNGAISQGAVLALVVYAILCCVLWDNPNVLAFNLVGLAWLAWPVGGWGMLLFVVLLILAYLHGSLGGLLALLASTIFIIWKSSKSKLLVTCLLLLITPAILFEWFFGNLIISCCERLSLLSFAWDNFASSPWWGIGPGSYNYLSLGYHNSVYSYAGCYWHSHNLITTTAAQLGLVGLLALSGLIWSIWKDWRELPLWAAALTIAFAIWSLVDEPTRFWGPGTMLMIAWSRVGTK
jgi:hypothetical protein